MKECATIFLGMVSLLIGASSVGASVEEYIEKAEEYELTGDLSAALDVMREAVIAYPEDAEAYAQLGLYLGMSAGQETDFGKQAALAFESFEVLDRAVALDSLNVSARFNRGMIGINVPEFLGRRNQAIGDLEAVLRIHESEEEVSSGVLAQSYFALAGAYEEMGEMEKALGAWRSVSEIAPESELRERADEAIARYAEVSQAQEPVKRSERTRDPGDLAEAEELFELARLRYEEGEYERAETLLSQSLEIDASNPDVYVLLAMSIGMQAEHGYDERIGEDRNLRANMAFRTIDYLDEAVKLAPDDPEIRLMRGVLGVQLPFFVRRLEQGMKDLEWVSQSSAHDTIKAEALYYLGVAHRKKTLSHWAAAVRDYPDSRAASQVLESLRPAEEGIDLRRYERPVLIVDFLLGFQEELPPQTAVWVEDEGGNPVKTLFVSGYAGHVGAREITLPKWGSSTDFETDATTGASIDLGHHVYSWDLTDRSGDRVPLGEYTVWVEVSYWPSMQYDLVSAPFPVTSEESSVRVEDGRLIPLLEVIYLP